MLADQPLALHQAACVETIPYPCYLLSPDHAPAQAFEPLELAQHAGRPALRFPTFDAALDEYFSKVCCYTATVGATCRSSSVALLSVG